jgi:hypothetical protein
MAENPPILFDDRYIAEVKRPELLDRRNHTGTQPASTIESGTFEVKADKDAPGGYVSLSASARVLKVVETLHVVLTDDGLAIQAATGEWVQLGVTVTLGVPAISLTILGGKP